MNMGTVFFEDITYTVLLLQTLVMQQMCIHPLLKIGPSKCFFFIPVEVTFAENYSAQLFLQTTEPFKKFKLHICAHI